MQRPTSRNMTFANEGPGTENDTWVPGLLGFTRELHDVRTQFSASVGFVRASTSRSIVQFISEKTKNFP